MLLTKEKPQLYALVVDSDKIVSQMVSFSLKNAGFECITTADGMHAFTLLKHKKYDLVITGLLLSNKNGHTLAAEILRGESRPVVMVHTSVKDQKITYDLIYRGVDDLSFKPTNYEILASKARALVERRRKLAELRHKAVETEFA